MFSNFLHLDKLGVLLYELETERRKDGKTSDGPRRDAERGLGHRRLEGPGSERRTTLIGVRRKSGDILQYHRLLTSFQIRLELRTPILCVLTGHPHYHPSSTVKSVRLGRKRRFQPSLNENPSSHQLIFYDNDSTSGHKLQVSGEGKELTCS